MYNDRDTIFRGGLALIICLAGLIDVVAHFNEFGGNPWLNAYTSTQWVVGTFILYLFGDICYQLYRRIRRVESYIHHALNNCIVVSCFFYSFANYSISGHCLW